jgi:hypothetical protein
LPKLEKNKLFGFFNLSPLTKFGNMEPIHVEESFKIFMNEKKIALEEKIEEENYERPKTLPSSLL